MLIVFVVMWTAGSYIGGRFKFGIAAQQSNCLPYKYYIIDTHDKTIPVDGYLSFIMDDRALPWYKPGTKFVKQLRAAHGDRIDINHGHVIINDDVVARLDPRIITKLEKDMSAFNSSRTLAKDQLWVMGTSTDSFDSRYWGPIDSTMINGQVYPLF
jgi:conjugal transfer pilin signal peptidase TrbI